MFRWFVLISVFVCALGEKFPILEKRIIGGEETTIQQFPHQVAMYYYEDFFCGGSIISKTVIITAAHCVQVKTPGHHFQVQVGSTYRNRKGLRNAVKKIIIHENFNADSLENDIGLLLLVKELEFSDSILPIPLAEYGEEAAVGDIAYVSGWGALVLGGPTAMTLHYVSVQIIDFQQCIKSYEEGNEKVYESMICAGITGGGKDACVGDSGGPLISNSKLIGVVSWGLFCGHEKYPGVYARISYLRNWIEENRPDK